MVVELVAAAASAVLAVVAVGGYMANRKQIRMNQKQVEMTRKQLEVSEKQVKTNEENLKLLSRAVEAVVAIADSQKKQVEALTRQFEQAGILKQREIALKEQQALLEKQRSNWSILTGIAKALGWAYERGLIGHEEE